MPAASVRLDVASGGIALCAIAFRCIAFRCIDRRGIAVRGAFAAAIMLALTAVFAR
jgi:hypothetical protein